MFATGLASIPTLCKPYYVLSNGEKYRADVARILDNNMILDEFTSVVNRETAKSLSVSMRKYINKNNLTGIVLASCHVDIIEFLKPDWIFDCDNGRHSIIKPDNMKKVAEIKIYV